MPEVSSSMRIGDPVAVSSVTARSWASSSARLRSLRSALIDLYMCDAARLTVTWSGWSSGQVVELAEHPQRGGQVVGVDAGHGRRVVVQCHPQILPPGQDGTRIVGLRTLARSPPL